MNKKYTIDQLRQVKGIGEKTIQRIIEQFDDSEYAGEYNPDIHIEPNSLVHGDMLEAMNGIPDNSVDMILTSPPYDNLRDYNNLNDYDSVFKQVYRVLEEGGVCVWVVDDQTVNGGKTGSSFKHALQAKENGLRIHDVMIWKKETFTDTGSLNVRYGNVFEYMFILSKGKPKTFNPLMDRLNKSYGDVKHGTIRQRDGTTKPISSKGKKIKQYGQRFNVWEINSEKNNETGHPAVFPERLVGDHIESWSNKGDVVLDMMMGSGTTPYVAKKKGRKYIGIELDKEYFDIAVKRVNGGLF